MKDTDSYTCPHRQNLPFVGLKNKRKHVRKYRVASAIGVQGMSGLSGSAPRTPRRDVVWRLDHTTWRCAVTGTGWRPLKRSKRICVGCR